MTETLGSSDTFSQTRRPRYPFVAFAKATDVISGMQLVGLTTDLSEGGCRISTRKGPFSEGTRILLEIAKNGVSLLTNATVVYNLKDQFMGICFDKMPPDQAAYPDSLDKSCERPGQSSPDCSLTTSRGFLSSRSTAGDDSKRVRNHPELATTLDNYVQAFLPDLCRSGNLLCGKSIRRDACSLAQLSLRRKPSMYFLGEHV